MSEPFIGEIRIFAFNFAPNGWAFCDGQLLPINQYQALFSLLGTFYGGDGRTNFALPNLQSRVPLQMGQGAGLSNYVLGQSGGLEQVTLSVAELPSHNHPLLCETSGGNTQTPQNSFLAVDASGLTALYSTSENATMSPLAIGNNGQNQPHPNVQPYLALNFCIALIGIFPTRS